MEQYHCISPLMFYNDIRKQNRYRDFAYGTVSPLITNPNVVTPFLVDFGPEYVGHSHRIALVELYDANTNQLVTECTSKFIEAGLKVEEIDGCVVMWFLGIFPLDGILTYEGQYYLRIKEALHDYVYSEVFCYTNNVDDCLKIEYWNPEGNIYLAGKYPVFPSANIFHYQLLLQTQLGKPEYSFEEEATTRLGYSFVESQVSKKTYKFNVVVPEYICDAMRLIRLCSEKRITSKGTTYEPITFDMNVEWQEQGDLASVTCEFDVDNIIVNLGGFKKEPGGDFNNDYNNDFYNE